MNSAILRHSIFWLVVIGLLTIYFGRVSDNYLQAFYFTTFLFPIALGTTYFFNYYLVPKFLVVRRYWQFALYFIYTLIFSLYLEMLVITLSFIVLANYQYSEMNPLTVDIFSLTITVYLIVIVIAFLRMFNSLQKMAQEKKDLLIEKKNTEKEYLQVKSQRKLIPIEMSQIGYIESLADYVKVVTSEKTTITKEKISKIKESLPPNFLRVHRSFIVNKHLIRAFTKEEIHIDETVIPIGRTYKKEVMISLENHQPPIKS